MSTSISLVACVAVALFLLAAPVVQQDAPAAPAVPTLASLTLPLDRLKDSHQEFDFRMSASGSSAPPESLGSVVLDTRIEAGKFTFTDRGDMQYGGKPWWIEMTTLGTVGNELRPEYLNVRGTTPNLDGQTTDFSAQFTAAAATVSYADKSYDLAVPAGSLTVDVLYRLVTLLPRRAGFVASYGQYLDANAMKVNPGGTITCASATENVDVGGKAVKAFRFDVTSDGRVFFSLWVDEAGRFVQSCLEGNRWLVAKG